MSRITGTDAANLIEAYNAVYAPQEEVELTEEQVQEDFENWVNSLVEEGHDLSEYTWEDMYEEYLNEVIRPTTGQMTAPRPTVQSPRPTPSAPATYNPAGGGMGGGRGSRGPQQSTRPAPTPSRFGTTTPKGSSVTSTGVSGLSPADRAAYSAGGGNAAAQRGMGQTTAQVIAQGRANLGRMDQGRPAPARPATPAPAARPAATAPARPAAPTTSPRPAGGTPSYAGAQGVKPVGTSLPANAVRPVAGAPAQNATFSAPAKPVNKLMTGMPSVPSMAAPAGGPKLSARAQALKAGGPQGGARARMLNQDLDMFDIVKGHLIDEGYADTEEAALQIMANMSEEWRQSILEAPMNPAELERIAQQASTEVTGKRKKSKMKRPAGMRE